MPWSDEQRLERVYRRASAIKAVRRARMLIVALPVLVLAGAVVASAASSDDDGRTLRVAGPSTTVLPEVTITVPPTHVGPTVLPTVTTPTVVTTRPVKPTVTTETTSPPTTMLPNCGGYTPGGSRPKPPEGMQVTTEASKPIVRRGDEVVLTIKAKWTGAQPFTYSRGDGYRLLGTLNGMIYFQSTSVRTGGQDTFQPGEEKTHSVTWDTSYACTVNEMKEARTPGGTYLIEGFWDSADGSWGAEPGQFQLVD